MNYEYVKFSKHLYIIGTQLNSPKNILRHIYPPNIYI